MTNDRSITLTAPSLLAIRRRRIRFVGIDQHQLLFDTIPTGSLSLPLPPIIKFFIKTFNY